MKESQRVKKPKEVIKSRVNKPLRRKSQNKRNRNLVLPHNDIIEMKTENYIIRNSVKNINIQYIKNSYINLLLVHNSSLKDLISSSPLK